MAILGRTSPLSTEPVLLYTVPAAKQAVGNISIVNRGGMDIQTSVFVRAKTDLAVSAVSVVSTGTGLTEFPTASFSGEASTEATLSVDSITLTEYALVAAGGFYFVNDELTAEINTDETVTIRVTSTDTNGVITGSEIVDGGTISTIPSGHTDGEIVLVGGNGNGAKLSESSLRFGVKAVSILTEGNGYKSTTGVTFSAGTGTTVNVNMKPSQIEDTDAFEYKVRLSPSGVLERTGLLLGEGDSLFVSTTGAESINAFFYGIEELA